MSRNGSPPRRTFLLEFNELCPGLLADFMAQGKLPNFRRLYDSSAIYTTDADELAPHLEPWIQWATVHSGLTFTEHGAFHLGDGRKMEAKCVAELLSDAGIRVGVFGSMNTNYTSLNGYYVPDPWDVNGVPQPTWLEPFYRTVARQVQNSSNGGGIPKRDLLSFGTFIARHGLRPSTARSVVTQLLQEKLQGGVSWRRASLLEQLQYDLFRYLDRRFEPQFATFFCNSTAHYQHYYWRNMHPDIFDIPPDAEDHPSLRSAIEYGYVQMDRLIGQFLRDFPDVVLILCTALSQQPWTETTKCTFKPKDFTGFLRFAEIPAEHVTVRPVMAEEFSVEFRTAEESSSAHRKLSELSLDGQPLMRAELKGASIFAACRINDARQKLGIIRRERDGVERPFADLFYMVHSVRSGRHHPAGVLWIRNGRHHVAVQDVPLTGIAPGILEHFSVPVPAHMRGEPLHLEHIVRTPQPAVVG